MADPNDYIVGWISAITPEYVAARAFLDEKHENPECLPRDSDTYTLGRIGKHNVVISVLPIGEYCTSSAARVAQGMLHSFPNLRICLMVGSGGGAPSPKHDIRLGDIVVSVPDNNGHGGVSQYDFGKIIQGEGFQSTRFLNQPPTALLAAVNGLKAEYESEGHELEGAINAVLKKKSRLGGTYKRPDEDSDKLYQSHVVHDQNNEATCEEACGNEPSKLVVRPDRTDDEDNPMVHYGLIASANQLKSNEFQHEI